MKRVCVIGHFGFGHDLLNGQTIKTKIVANEVEKNVGKDEIVRIDTHGGLATLLKLPFVLFYAIAFFKNVIIMPAHNGLRIIAPLLVFYNLFFKKKIHYVVVGGWMPSFIESKRVLRRQLKKFDHIYVETFAMKNILDKQGFGNITVMPNCKELHVLDEFKLVYNASEPYRVCTFSRVMKEKGIEDAVNAVKFINEKLGRIVYELDIYGQIDSEQFNWFEGLKANFPQFVQYKGFVPFDRTTEILKNYYVLLFPTYYEGEGFAGTVIDAFAAGLPVIASNWKYNSEIIKNGETGLVFNNYNQFVQFLADIANKAIDVESMRIKCINESKRYLPQCVLSALCRNI